MTIIVSKTVSIGSKTSTATASAELPDAVIPLVEDTQTGDIIRITRALLQGIEPVQFVTNDTDTVPLQCTPPK